MNLIVLPNKIIRQKSKDVVFPLKKEKIKLIENMISYVDESQKKYSKIERPAIGIAAVQVGVLDNMYYVNCPDYDNQKGMREFLINPIIIKKSKKLIALKEGEGCLSVKTNIPNQKGFIYRSFEITIKGYSYFQKKEIIITKNQYSAIVLQHEQDHLDGKLFIDVIDKMNPWNIKKNGILI